MNYQETVRFFFDAQLSTELTQQQVTMTKCRSYIMHY